MRGRKVSETSLSKIFELYRNGATKIDISERFNITLDLATKLFKMYRSLPVGRKYAKDKAKPSYNS